MTEYSYEIKISFGGLEEAESKEGLIKQVKENFYEDYNIRLMDEEITDIEEVSDE